MASIALTLSVCNLCHGDAVVVPNEFASAEAPQNNRYPIFVDGGIRYQQVYSSSEFGFSGPSWITEIAFRGDSNDTIGGPLDPYTIEGFTISLSTTQNGPDQLSNIFDENLSGDFTIVFSGDMTFASDGIINPDGTSEFDFRFVLQSPFWYDPADGHLLLDILNTDPDDNNIGYFFDATDNLIGDGVSRLFTDQGAFGDSSGIADSIGVVTQFVTVVPEPTTPIVFVALSCLTIAVRRKRQSSHVSKR